MTLTPTVSAIIPAYNSAGCVARAIESALCQTYAPIEILVVDDGSTDDTAQIVREYPEPVRLIRQENGGPAAARNRGAREAGGEWLALLDADDAWLPERLEKQLPYTEDPSIGVVQCYDTAGSCMKAPPHITFDALWQRNCVGNSTALVRHAAFDQVCGFDEDRSLICVEDYNLWLRLVAAGWEIAVHPECLVLYTPATGNLSSQLERFGRAELANVERIGRQFGLAPNMIEAKRIALYVEYGIELLHHRDLRAARRFLGPALRQQPSLKRLAAWSATFVPVSLLDWRRQTAQPS